MHQKSQKRYEQRYEQFLEWKESKNTRLTSENVLLAYFKELSKKNAPNTLRSIWSMLKRFIKRKDNVDIKKFFELRGFVKVNQKGCGVATMILATILAIL